MAAVVEVIIQMNFKVSAVVCLLALYSKRLIWYFHVAVQRTSQQIKPGFHVIAPVATIVTVVEKRVLKQKYFLSDANDTVFPHDRRRRSISLTQ